MKLDFPVHEVGGGVLVAPELHAPTEERPLRRQPVQPNIRAVHDSLNEPLVHRVVDFRPKRRDKRIQHPVEHPADRDEVVLHVRIRGIGFKNWLYVWIVIIDYDIMNIIYQ